MVRCAWNKPVNRRSGTATAKAVVVFELYKRYDAAVARQDAECGDAWAAGCAEARGEADAARARLLAAVRAMDG